MPETEKAPSPSRAKLMLRTAGRTMLTAAVIGIASLGGLAGYQALAARAADGGETVAAPPTPVAAVPIRFETQYVATRRFGGQFEAPRETALGFEAGGTVAAVLVREGDRVEAGEVLARADTRILVAERGRLRANRTALEAQAELARRTNDRQAALRNAGHLSQQRLDDSSLTLARIEAEIAGVDAGLAEIDVRLAKSDILAPFAGVVGRRLLDEGTVAAPGAPVVTLLESGHPRFRAAIDPVLADRLRPGDAATVSTLSGDLPARLVRLTPDLDPATRARVAYFDVDGDAPARSTGEVLLDEAIPAKGAWVPLSALRQGPRGTWTLLTVAPEDGVPTIGFETAEIVAIAEGRAFVRGSLQDGDLYLPDGTHRVVPGEAVSLVADASALPGQNPEDRP